MKNLTRKEKENLIRSYNNSRLYSLNECYNNCSSRKWKAFKYCLDLKEKYNGKALKILSYNTFMFTAAFEFIEDGVEKLMYITPSYDRSFPIDLEVGC